MAVVRRRRGTRSGQVAATYDITVNLAKNNGNGGNPVSMSRRIVSDQAVGLLKDFSICKEGVVVFKL